jgi:phosphate-selective porin OprO/OprP
MVILLAAAGAPAWAASATPASPYDALWEHAVLVRGTEADAWQELRLVGRVQCDYYDFRDGDRRAAGWANRRTRLGLKGQFLRDWSFSVETDLNIGPSTGVFNKLTDAYVRWSPDAANVWTLGRQGVRFTLDGSTSSLVLPTIDRSAISYNIGMIEESIPGFTYEGDRGKWFYRAGVFTSGTANPYFGRMDAGAIGFVSTGWHFDQQWGLPKAFLRADYLLQGESPRNATGTPQIFARDHHQAASLSLQLEDKPWTLGIDLCASEGQGTQSDLHGLEVEPGYWLNDDWQAVYRFTYLESKRPNGVYEIRYESWVAPGRGNRYVEHYFGLNRYFYGHKLKLMFALEHARMHDLADDGGAYAGWGFTTGFRVSW